jgi:hypothetical protein
LNANPQTSPAQQTTVRLNIYGSSLPPPGLSVQPVTLNVTLVWNTLPSVAYSDILPLDYDLEDYKIEFQSAVNLAQQGNLAVFNKDDEAKINEMISQPKIVREELLRLNGDSMVDRKSLLSDDILEKLIELKSKDIVVPKSLVIAHSTAHKNSNLDSLNKTYTS